MAHKQMCFRAAAPEEILRGASELADAVRVTLGPKSKCVLIERKYGRPIAVMNEAGEGGNVEKFRAGVSPQAGQPAPGNHEVVALSKLHPQAGQPAPPSP
jgi:hypothetical protein